jgi:rhodanese-related sulfurtransferase
MKRLYHSSFLLALAALVISCATAVPSRPVEDVSADQLKKLLDEKALLMLVDTRTEYEYRKGHIPTAVSIPPEKFDVLSTLLPEDKDIHLVFYCRGAG